MTDLTSGSVQAERKTKALRLRDRPWMISLIYALVTIVILIALSLRMTDYVGSDNDDIMRLVEVRDLLAGQSWFDMTQYRLGLAGGTLMHWSRFIDLPIAALITFFRIFTSGGHAEALALTVWPVTLVYPTLLGMGLAGYRMAGRQGMHVALGLTVITILVAGRFAPGSIDHDNAQLALLAIIMATLVDQKKRKSWMYAIAAVAAAIALGIGAETTPLIAVICIVVATLWAWEGQRMQDAARAFSSTLAIAVTLAFLVLTPPHLYSMVTCDNLSLGFYGVISVGAIGLTIAVIFATSRPRLLRFAALGLVGVAVGCSAMLIAPQCLRSPLADLDPLLVQLWLNWVGEAQSLVRIAGLEPYTLGGFYASGLLAILVCISGIYQQRRPQLYAILLAPILANWVISLVQVRGAEFANFLAVLPLTLFIIDLRSFYISSPRKFLGATAYILGVMASVPAVWAVIGAAGAIAADKINGNAIVADDKSNETFCNKAANIAPLASLPAGVVANPVEMGTAILRYTPHRVLSAPYHRNQGGMLTALHIGMATPAEAPAFLTEAKIDYVAFCRSDMQTKKIAELYPDGLYAALLKGRVPTYLDPIVSSNGGNTEFFRFKAQ